MRTIACVRSATSWQRRQPGSRGRARRARTGLPVHERAPGNVSHSHDGPRPEGFGLGLLCLAKPTGFGSGDRRRRSDASYPHDPRWIAWNLWRAACSCRLNADGFSVGRKRIARLMRAARIAGVTRRRSEMPSSLMFPACRDAGPPSSAGFVFMGLLIAPRIELGVVRPTPLKSRQLLQRQKRESFPELSAPAQRGMDALISACDTLDRIGSFAFRTCSPEISFLPRLCLPVQVGDLAQDLVGKVRLGKKMPVVRHLLTRWLSTA